METWTAVGVLKGLPEAMSPTRSSRESPGETGLFSGTNWSAKSLKIEVETVVEPERRPFAVPVTVATPWVPALTCTSACDFPKAIVTC